MHADGVLGGYCDNVVRCTNGDTGCDRNTSICINCTTGYHVIDNYCVQGKVFNAQNI